MLPFIGLGSPVVSAAVAGPADGGDQADAARVAADEATNPLPIKRQLAFKPMYTFPNGATRYKAELQFEPILPYKGLLIPDLDVEGLWSVARIQLTGESLQNAMGTAGGLEDLDFVDVVAKRFGPLTLAAGGATVFPLATSTALGQGKWQVGPAVAYRWDPLAALKIASLVQGLWSVAGSSQSPNLAYVTVQPFVTVDLPAALFFSSDPTMKFYWAGGRRRCR
jgi:hypothetical protein